MIAPHAFTLEDAPDSVLVARSRAGDTEAFAVIVARHKSRMRSKVMSLLRNRADADEVVADVFVRAWRGLRTFRGESSLVTWLYRIAVNAARNKHMHRQTRAYDRSMSMDAPANEHEEQTLGESLPDPAHTPDEVMELEEFSLAIIDSIKELDRIPRDVLTLCALRMLSYEEIAAAQGCGVGTVKSRIARAREQLRRRLATRFPEEVGK